MTEQPDTAAPDLTRDPASREAVRRAMLAIAGAGGKPGETPLEPLAAIRAAALIEDAARAGRTWADIGLALGYTGPDAAGSAYRVIALIPERLPRWTCWSCEQHIQDCGPGIPPADAEFGHAAGCARLAAATAARQAAR